MSTQMRKIKNLDKMMLRMNPLLWHCVDCCFFFRIFACSVFFKTFRLFAISISFSCALGFTFTILLFKYKKPDLILITRLHQRHFHQHRGSIIYRIVSKKIQVRNKPKEEVVVKRRYVCSRRSARSAQYGQYHGTCGAFRHVEGLSANRLGRHING